MTNTLLHARVCVCVCWRGGQTRTLLGKIREREEGERVLVRESSSGHWPTPARRSLIRPLKSDVSIGGGIVGFGEAGGFEIVKRLPFRERRRVD